MAPFDEPATRLLSIPGVGKRTVETIVAEIGVDMSRFPTPGHLASWVGLYPVTTSPPANGDRARPARRSAPQGASLENRAPKPSLTTGKFGQSEGLTSRIVLTVYFFSPMAGK